MKKTAILSLVFACAACFTSFFVAAKENTPITIANVSIVDVKSGILLPNKDVLIESNKITAIKNHQSSLENREKTIDGTNKYLIPGLWDMHTHIRSYTGQDNLPMFVAHGITGIRDLGITNHALIKQWQQQITQEKLIGPRIISSAVIIEGASPRFPSSLSISKTEQIKPAIDQLADEGAEIIKLFQNIPPNIFTQLVDYAHKKGLKTAGHIPTGWSQIKAAEINLDSIEHLFGINDSFSQYSAYQFSEDEIQRLANTLIQHNTFQSPTIIGYKYREKLHQVAVNPALNDNTFDQAKEFDYTPAYFKAWWKAIKDRTLENYDIDSFEQQKKRFKFNQKVLAELNKRGVKILAGTDTPNPYLVLGSSLHDELAMYVESGISTLEALRSATLYPGDYFDKEGLSGQVKVGSYADLLLLNDNPLENINNTRSIGAVIANGQLYNTADLDKIKQEQQQQLREYAFTDFDQYIYMDVRRNGIETVQAKYPLLNKAVTSDTANTTSYSVKPNHLLRLAHSLKHGLQPEQAKLALQWNLLMFPEHEETQKALDTF
jgi:imidazolonepropionase-like amidohydrolase